MERIAILVADIEFTAAMRIGSTMICAGLCEISMSQLKMDDFVV